MSSLNPDKVLIEFKQNLSYSRTKIWPKNTCHCYGPLVDSPLSYIICCLFRTRFFFPFLKLVCSGDSRQIYRPPVELPYVCLLRCRGQVTAVPIVLSLASDVHNSSLRHCSCLSDQEISPASTRSALWEQHHKGCQVSSNSCGSERSVDTLFST